jgi:hypothetical protein
VERTLNAYLLGRLLDATQTSARLTEHDAERIAYEELRSSRHNAALRDPRRHRVRRLDQGAAFRAAATARNGSSAPTSHSTRPAAASSNSGIAMSSVMADSSVSASQNGAVRAA